LSDPPLIELKCKFLLESCEVVVKSFRQFLLVERLDSYSSAIFRFSSRGLVAEFGQGPVICIVFCKLEGMLARSTLDCEEEMKSATSINREYRRLT
jgi:hypothetical protein